MLIQEAMTVFWQSLRDTWEELLPLAVVNIAWFLSWALPLFAVVSLAVPILTYVLLALGVFLFPISTAGIYYVTHRVARGKTFHFADFIEGVRIYWWRAILWLLANLLVIWLIWVNLWFYSGRLGGVWGFVVGGFWLALLAFWLVMQLYFWPMLIQIEEPRMLLAWRNSALLILVNPFYAFFFVSFTLLIAVLSAIVAIILIFAGMTIIALLGNNAVLILLHKLGKIEDPRPPTPRV
jgi:hypothetical protein